MGQLNLLDALIPAVLMITTGLLFLDLVPLQETMVCKDYTNSTECADFYYSQTYDHAREKFLAAAAKAGATIEHIRVVEKHNRQYFMDTAFIRGSTQKKLLVHSSGTHGVEGYTGSAIQTQLLNEWNTSISGPSVLFVHAVNPYGMAHNRRFNENNVDLNRNYLTSAEWKDVLQRDHNAAGYETLRDVLSPPRAPRLIDRYLSLFRFAARCARHGFSFLKRAFVTGQYHHPEGVYYGGVEEQPSVTKLREILRTYRTQSEAEQSVFIDVHTGLGKTGVDTIMVSSAEDAALAAQVFPNHRVQNDKDAKHGPSGGYNLAAGIIRPVPELGPHTLAVTEEFGTVNPLFVARAVVLENAAYHWSYGSYVHKIMGDWVKEVFYPQTISYKASTLKNGAQAFWQAFEYLNKP